MRFQSSFKLIGALVLPALLANCMPHIDNRQTSMPSEMELTLHSDAVQGTVNLVNGEEYNGYMFYKVENGWKRYSRAYAQTKLNKKQMPEIEEALEKAGTLIESGDDNGRPVRQYWIIAQGTIEQGQAILD